MDNNLPKIGEMLRDRDDNLHTVIKVDAEEKIFQLSDFTVCTVQYYHGKPCYVGPHDEYLGHAFYRKTQAQEGAE